MFLEEVTVTAQKREQSVQDVGISITAFDGNTIDSLGFQTTIDVANQVPNFYLRNEGTVTLLTIRGNSLIDFGYGNESPVGFYIDEVYRSTIAGQQEQLFDIGRIEVLRGPQGSLYGRNTTAGLVHFISRKPTDEFEGYTTAQIGSYEQRIIETAVSGPLTDSIQGRLALKYNRDDGWQENKAGPGGDWASTDAVSGRGQLQLNLSDNLDVLLSTAYSEQDNVFTGYGFVGVLDPETFLQCTTSQAANGNCINLAGFQNPDLNSKDVYSELRDPKVNVDIFSVSAKVNWDLGDGLELVSITAYEDLDQKLEGDEDASETGVLGGAFQFFDIYSVKTKTFTQEFRLAGNFNERHDWVAGVYYFDDDKDPLTSTVKDLEIQPGTPDTVATVETKSWAVFGHLDSQISSSLNLILGLRYTRDSKDADIVTQGVPTSGDFETDAVTGEIGLNWHLNDSSMLYSSISRGFKSGEFNTTLLNGDIDGATAADEEIVWAYELGAKLTFWDGKGRFNSAVFYQDIEDKQGATIPGDTPVLVTRLINFGDVDIYGAEFELMVQPTDSLELSLGMALLDTEIKSDPGTGIVGTWGAGANGGLGDFFPIDGTELPLAADVTFNGVVRYQIDLGNYGASTLQADFSWTDDQAAFADVPFNEIDSYGLLNLRAFWESTDARYNASVFVENVTDEDVALNKFFIGGLDYQAVQWGRPRWYGVTVGIQF